MYVTARPSGSLAPTESIVADPVKPGDEGTFEIDGGGLSRGKTCAQRSVRPLSGVSPTSFDQSPQPPHPSVGCPTRPALAAYKVSRSYGMMYDA